MGLRLGIREGVQRPTVRHYSEKRYKSEFLHWILPSRAQEPSKRRGGKIVGIRGEKRKAEEHGTPNQLSRPQKDSQRLKRKAQGLHGSVPIL